VDTTTENAGAHQDDNQYRAGDDDDQRHLHPAWSAGLRSSSWLYACVIADVAGGVGLAGRVFHVVSSSIAFASHD
jgi:hypothetical protein